MMARSEQPITVAKVAGVTAKATWSTTKFAARAAHVTTRRGRQLSAAAARRALGGTRYNRSVEDVNGRLHVAIDQLEAAIRVRDAEIRRLRAELDRRKR